MAFDRLHNVDEPSKYVESANQCASREHISAVIRNKAESLRREAVKLDNLAKLMDILPTELESALYPYLMDSIYHSNKVY